MLLCALTCGSQGYGVAMMESIIFEAEKYKKIELERQLQRMGEEFESVKFAEKNTAFSTCTQSWFNPPLVNLKISASCTYGR